MPRMTDGLLLRAREIASLPVTRWIEGERENRELSMLDPRALAELGVAAPSILSGAARKFTVEPPADFRHGPA